MRYTNWEKRSNEPNYVPIGKEACLNLFKKWGFTWNDEPCGNKYCFICEDRRHLRIRIY